MEFQRTVPVALLAATVIAVPAIGFVGCQNQPSPVNFSVSVPTPDQIDFSAQLTQQYGIGLSASYTLPDNIGSILLTPESPGQGFGLQLDLNTAAFLKSSWVQFQEVTTLPTGAPFPTWLTGPVIDVTSPDLNANGIAYHFYFGDHGQMYVGAAGVISAINSNTFPNVGVGYTFYDNQGRVVVGFQFFGPSTTSPGGIFIGTNLTPFLPTTPSGPSGTSGASGASGALEVAAAQLRSASSLELVEQAARLEPVEINGQSVVSNYVTTGPEASRYRSQSAVQGLIDRFTAASRNAK